MYRMIYFFGPDGAGKTTYANLTAYLLKKKGFKVYRTSIKQHHTLAFILLKILCKTLKYDFRIVSYYGFPNKFFNKNKKIWEIIEFFSTLLVTIYRVYIPLFLGYIVICDRYLLDTLVTLSVFVKDMSLINSIPARVLVNMIPKSSLIVYLEADSKTLIRRKKDEPLSIHLLDLYKLMYNYLINSYILQVIRIDTSSNLIFSVFNKLLRKIELV